MKPIKFKECNTIFAKDQPEYNQLPAFKNKGKEGEVISCWKLSRWERLRVLLFGEIWLSLWTFNKPLTPSFMTTKKSDVLITKKS
ncbi:hypothetical protein KA005_41385 [bacterium]|nr:hypothetical protein [bacterium]